MAKDQLPVIDATVASTTAWLEEIAAETGTGRRDAFHVLCSGLHALRDGLPPDEVARVGRGLPVLVRGLYFEGWHAAETQVRDLSVTAWLATLEGHLLAANADAVPPAAAARAVLRLVGRHLDAGARRRLSAQLPVEVADLLRAA